MEEIEILCEELEDIILEDTREVVTVDKPVYPELEDLTITPTTEEQKFKSSEYGYNNVTVEAIQDENLKAENIKSGTEILGVKGNFTGGKFKPRYMSQPIKFQNYTGTELDHEVSMLDITYFTNMSNMFAYCRSLTSLDLSGWETSNTTDMYQMFYYCDKLTNLDLSSWNTSNVTNMGGMFGWCINLTELTLSNFDTAKVNVINSMFQYCKNLTFLDLSSFDTSNITDMKQMFLSCQKLKHLDIRNFTFDKVTSYNLMFSSVPKDCLIIVKGETEQQWITSKFTNLTNVKTVAEIGE